MLFPAKIMNFASQFPEPANTFFFLLFLNMRKSIGFVRISTFGFRRIYTFEKVLNPIGLYFWKIASHENLKEGSIFPSKTKTIPRNLQRIKRKKPQLHSQQHQNHSTPVNMTSVKYPSQRPITTPPDPRPLPWNECLLSLIFYLLT